MQEPSEPIEDPIVSSDAVLGTLHHKATEETDDDLTTRFQKIAAEPVAAIENRAAMMPDIPGYRVLSQLGRGGMGVVYEAEHLALKRLVAIKLVAASVAASEKAIARFRLESRAIAAIAHPGVCQIYEVGEVASTPYLVMEYIQGQTLAQLIRTKPPSYAEAARITKSIAEAVQACHQANILHRDLKPANIMLTQSDAIKVMDFGLSKQIGDSDSANTNTGEILGTPNYMAPEQASGVVKQIGPACDVYGIGAVLYEMLVGRPPHFGSDPMQTVMQVLTSDPVSPRKLQPKIPKDLETICLKCLEHQPKRRYETAADLANDIDRYLTARPILARPASTIERCVKWLKRHPVACGWIATGFVFAIAVVLGVFFHLNRLQRELDRSSRLFSQSQDWGSWLVDEHIPAVARLRGGGQLQSSLVKKTLEHLQQLESDASADMKLTLYIAQAYTHIADVQADPAFMTQERLGQAVESYKMAANLYEQVIDSPMDLEQGVAPTVKLAELLLRMSSIQEALGSNSGAVDSVERALGLLKEEQGGNVDQSRQLQVAIIEAESAKNRFDLAVMPVGEVIAKNIELYAECNSITRENGGPQLGRVAAKIAIELGDLLQQYPQANPSRKMTSDNPVSYYKQAIARLKQGDQDDDAGQLHLIDAASKLSAALTKERRFDEAIEALDLAIESQRSLVQSVPESDRFQLNLLKLLHEKFNVATLKEDISSEMLTADTFLKEVQPLYQLKAETYEREMLKAFVVAGIAYRDRGDLELAVDYFVKANQLAELIVTQRQSSSDKLSLANVLMLQAESIVMKVNKRSILSQRLQAHQDAIELLKESVSIYEELGQSTQTERGSPYWSTIDLMHRIENDFDSMRRANQEAGDTDRLKPSLQ